jgi:hypothetical protein
MHASEIFGDRWVIPGNRYKTGIDHVVPLIGAIKKLLPACKDGFVFSTDGGKKPMRGFTVPKKYLDAKIAEIRKRDRRKAMPAWTFHDLRRTGRTLLAELGVNRETAEAVLGHVIGGVEGTYNQHKYMVEKTDALTRLRDEAAELNATADRKLRDGNYALGQARHTQAIVAQMERSISERERKLKELGEPELVAREQAAEAKLAEAKALMATYSNDKHAAAIYLRQCSEREAAEQPVA